MISIAQIRKRPDTERVTDLRRCVRDAMEQPPVRWDCPARIDGCYMSESLPVRKARAIALKLSKMPTDLWDGQLLAGSMTLEEPRLHAEWGFPDYTTEAEREEGRKRGVSIHSIFGHIVPDYPKLLSKGLLGIRAEAEAQRPHAKNAAENAFLDSVVIAVEAVMDYAKRLAERCETEAMSLRAKAKQSAQSDEQRKLELRQMAANLRQVPSGPAQTFWQALQSVWLLHMIFHSTMNGNAMGRLDQYVWPYLQADLEAGRIEPEEAAELVDCFCLKFNERAKTTDEQRPEARELEKIDLSRRTRHYTSSQLGTRRDSLDATNHWLQNIVVGGLTPTPTVYGGMQGNDCGIEISEIPPGPPLRKGGVTEVSHGPTSRKEGATEVSHGPTSRKEGATEVSHGPTSRERGATEVPTFPPFSKGGRGYVPPFEKGGLGGISKGDLGGFSESALKSTTLTQDGNADGTNPLTFLLLESYRRNQMTNPLLTVRVNRRSPEELIRYVCDVLKDGGGMPAIFNDECLVPALEGVGIPHPDALDYTNDGCWEVIIPGRTDFRFQRLSMMLCLEWALNHGRSRLDGTQQGPDTGDPRAFKSFDEVWQAFLTQMDAMIERTVCRVVETIDDRNIIAPVPLLSALIDGAIDSRRDMTAGGAKFRTFGMLAESAAHTIDSLTAIKTVIFEESPPLGRGRGWVKQATMSELCDALDANFEGYAPLRAKLLAAPKYGNDNEQADTVGREFIDAFTATVARHAEAHKALIKFPCGVGTFSWYIGIGEGLGASPDGRLSKQPVSSNFSPALGRDMEGIPSAILSYSKMQGNLPAGGPLDLRLARRLVEGDEGTTRMASLIRTFVDVGGSMMTLTVADTEELRAAQREPEKYRSLRVRMGGWCAYFTMLSREQQEHHIRRQEARS